MRTFRSRGVLWPYALAITLVLGSPVMSHATHFRYGHYTWVPTGANTVEFRLQNAFRRDGYVCVSAATLMNVPCSSADGFPGVGDLFVEFIGATRFNFGDGSPALGSSRGPLVYVVTSIDIANDWLFAQALDPSSLPAIDTTISHTYPAPGVYTAFTDSCCRISPIDDGNAHINNPDGGYRVETRVTVGTANRSPISALPPIVICPFPATCTFSVPGADGDGDALRFRLATPAESSSFRPGGTCPTTFCQPGEPGSRAPNPASISPSGEYTWDTSDATIGAAGTNTLYSTQIVIEDLDSSGDAKSSVALTFLIQLVPCPPSGCTPPIFPPPPAGQPPVCNTTVPAFVGNTVSFMVSASDTNVGDTVVLNAVGLPAAAVLVPSLPVNGNPVASAFSWTPAPADAGTTVITFTATSVDGTALCPVTIDVALNSPPVAACTPGPNPSGKNVPPANNEDGFYRLTSTDIQDGSSPLFVTNATGSATFGPFASGTVVKITEAPGARPKIRGIDRPGSAVAAHIILDSDATVYAVDSAGARSASVTCRVAPPPK